MKADRLLSALLLLQAHGRLTGRQLANRLEVSMRTVHRDMEALSAAGVPVLALRGTSGGWQLDEGWRTQVPGLDEAELRALLMAQPRVVGDRRLAEAAERALDKLMASLPAGLREKAASIQKRLYVDTFGWRGTPENLGALPVVQDAVSRDRKLKIRYARPGEEAVERVLDPLGLVAKGSVWYLVARSPEGLRTYRVSRIERATLLDAPSDRPAGFDLAAFWKTSTARFKESLPRYDTTLRLMPAVARDLRMRMPRDAIQEVAGQEAPGWLTLHVRFDSEGDARFVIGGLGARVEVLEPVALRDRVCAEAEEILARVRAARRRTLPRVSRTS